MKRLVLFSVAAMYFAMNLAAQNADKKVNVPKENSKVTKEYDENGNLTKFDSVYTYSWSSDTTLVNSISPDQLKNIFGDQFGFFPDSSFMDNSFIQNFDDFFAQPLQNKADSTLMKKYGNHAPFQLFGFNNDSIDMNFPDFGDIFQNFNQNNQDSVLSGSRFPQQKSMDEMMKMLQDHLKRFEEQHKKLLNNESDWQ